MEFVYTNYLSSIVKFALYTSSSNPFLELTSTEQ